MFSRRALHWRSAASITTRLGATRDCHHELLGGLGVTAMGQTFRAGVDAVAVDVLVTRNGRPVVGLTADDFTVLDNDVPQQIELVLLEDVPITLLLVLDTSGSVRGAPLVQLRTAAEAAAEASCVRTIALGW